MRGRLTPREQVRRLRLGTGLVLFAYVLTHLLNHSLGIVSLPVLNLGRGVFTAAWGNPLGLTLLYGALAIHLALALWSLYLRRSLRMPSWEASQLVLGLMIPPLLVLHVLATRLAQTLFGTDPQYEYVVAALWSDPTKAAQQLMALGVAWLHGCIGLHFWLRLRPWYPRVARYLYAGALLVPVLAVLGFVAAGKEVGRLMAEPGWFDLLAIELSLPDPDQAAFVYRLERSLLVGYAALLLGTLAARFVRLRLLRRRAVVVTYPNGRRVEVLRGTTILEASRFAGIPHASVCGGRGRCSTCRSRVGAGLEALPPASEAERRVLQRVKAPPNVRLACQTRPTADVEVVPLLPPGATPRDAYGAPGTSQGHEEEIAILFADLRAFTRFAESKLPYDVVFVLNRYFRAMGTAVEQAGGRVDKFIGDGVMALFGVGSDPQTGCRQALAGARAMAESLEEVNRALHHELDEPLRIGIGIHAGPVIVGEMGYDRATSVTAIGDAVNIASRLEALTKEHQCQLIVSEAVAARAGVDLRDFARDEIMVRGRTEPLAIFIVPDARTLPDPFQMPAVERRERAPVPV